MSWGSTRQWTEKLYKALDEGVILPETIVNMCLAYMSEAEVEDMCRCNDVLQEEDNDGE